MELTVWGDPYPTTLEELVVELQTMVTDIIGDDPKRLTVVNDAFSALSCPNHAVGLDGVRRVYFSEYEKMDEEELTAEGDPLEPLLQMTSEDLLTALDEEVEDGGEGAFKKELERAVGEWTESLKEQPIVDRTLGDRSRTSGLAEGPEL